MALKNYNDALVKVADSLVFSIDQALLKTTAPIQITDAIDMIATGEIHHLPSILSSVAVLKKRPGIIIVLWYRSLRLYLSLTPELGPNGPIAWVIY